ncbi:MAG TPA: endo-1,4-beta-xylanase [Candidatus Sulfotelmatobacter sp.]|jgi:endo-1,4-beta-xylanase|nr:endo-1,4-beta-xylanase [Candidatus Sulfotelmatobacter sp.]
MTEVIRKSGLFLAMIGVLVPLALSQKNDSETLRKYADPMGFWVGTTIQGRMWNRDPQYKPVMAREFNAGVSIVFPNLTEPERGHFDFDAMDEAMSFARQNKMRLMGHTLIYRNMLTAPWMNFQHDCGGWSAKELDGIMKEHIQAIVRHGGDTYYSWEVVNEPTNPTHNGCWSRILGEDDYIVKAFQYAHEANPNALLLLNDTFGQAGIEKDRAAEFFDLVKRTKKKGAPIDVVGTEMHWELPQLRPTYLDEFKAFLASAREAGVKVHITEMDVYQGPEDTPQAFQKQKEVFYNVVHTCLKDSNCIGFMTWGIGDRYSWLRNEEGKNYTNAKPVLFDESYAKKPAYEGVLQALKEGR